MHEVGPPRERSMYWVSTATVETATHILSINSADRIPFAFSGLSFGCLIRQQAKLHDTERDVYYAVYHPLMNVCSPSARLDEALKSPCQDGRRINGSEKKFMNCDVAPRTGALNPTT